MTRALSTLAALTVSCFAAADTITVCLDGSCDYSDIQSAINAASDGDVIEIAAGTYYPSATIDTLGRAVTLRGVIGKDGTPASIIDGQDSIQVLVCASKEGADTVFENLLITGGYLTWGGGMFNAYSSPTLTDCTFEGNSAEYGGGMYNWQGSSPTLMNCAFIECCQVVPPNSFFDKGGNDYDSWCDECRANVDCVGGVDAADLGLILSAWNTTEAQYDIDGDGVVGGGDLGMLLGSWGVCP